MSEKRSFIIIGVVLAVLVIFVYQFSTPRRHMRLAPVTGDIENSLPKDTTAKTDTTAK